MNHYENCKDLGARPSPWPPAARPRAPCRSATVPTGLIIPASIPTMGLILISRVFVFPGRSPTPVAQPPRPQLTCPCGPAAVQEYYTRTKTPGFKLAPTPGSPAYPNSQ